MTFCLFKFNRGLEPPNKLYWVRRRSRLGARLVTRGLLVNQVLCDKTEKNYENSNECDLAVGWVVSPIGLISDALLKEENRARFHGCECPTKRAVLRNIHCFNLNLKDTLALSLHNILSTHLNESYTFQSIRRHERVILCTSLPLTSAATRHSPHIYTRHSTAFHDVSSSCKLHQETVAKKEQEHGRREVAKQHLRSAFCDHNPFQ